MTLTIADTSLGRVEGRERQDAVLFSGIPFAAPPIGDLRFRPPEPVEPWTGVRPALRFGPSSWQNPGALGGFLDRGEQDCDEDCLYLNVVTPAVDGRARPVMVWIHGGGFTSGSGAIPWYDGTSFATRGDVVVVTINYRLGALGFLHLAEVGGEAYASSGLCGILDQVAALEWVRDNIAAFGGDPGNVTIFGESAGGMSVGTLLGLPRARGLFHHAIAQSGAADHLLGPTSAARTTASLLDELGVRTLDELLVAPAETVLAAQTALTDRRLGGSGTGGGLGGLELAMPFQPVLDGVELPAPPLEAIRGGSASEVSLLTGTTRDEWNLFHLMARGHLDETKLLKRFDLQLAGIVEGGGQQIVDTYREARPDASPDEVWCAVLTDRIFRLPAIRLAEAQSAHRPRDTHMYRFDWASRAFDGALGACHALDIPFTFNNLDKPGTSIFLGDGPAPTRLAELMHDAWWHAARNGDPNHADLPTWPAYDSVKRSTVTFADDAQVNDDPEAERRLLWGDR